MRHQKILSCLLSAVLMGGFLPAVPAFAESVSSGIVVESSSIDGFSVKLPEESASFTYQYFAAGRWSDMQTYESDGDSAPGQESELIMVPAGTTKLRANVASKDDIHLISVSHEPVKYRVAAMNNVGTPSVFSRSDWGADESYTFPIPADPTAGSSSSSSDTAKGDAAPVTETDVRVKDCLEAQKTYPTEFKTSAVVAKDAKGRSYSWPLQYSKTVKLLAIHHSALIVTGDPRPAAERMRALYKYHARNKGWGDIGYHFVVDEDGLVYEGRQGGTYVVGGHAYCNNVGTIGIMLMGNFELEMPSQAQAQGLQRLLDSLAREYGLDVRNSVQFHGKTFATPIVAHRDLLSTLCPGYTLYSGLTQIIGNVQTGRLDGIVKFPPPKVAFSSSSSSPSGVTPSSPRGLAEGISFIGRTSISINPGGKQRLSFIYTAPESGAYQGKKVADVQLSTTEIKLWQDDGLHQVPITKGVLLDSDLPGGESVDIQLIVQSPNNAGTYWMDIAGLRFSLAASGRRARTGEYTNPFSGNPAMIVHPSQVKKSTEIAPRVREQSRPSLQTSSFSSASSLVETPRRSVSTTVPGKNSIRLRLSATASPAVTFVGAGSIGGTSVNAGTAVNLVARSSQCVALRNGSQIAASSVVRLESSQPLTIEAVRSRIGSYAGVIECRVIDNVLTLINELPMEDYLAGLAEEPDTEPYEKQRAFAIAARTYASFYLQSDQRKFPGKPYDGSDDPATFQSYLGVNFAGDNPSWVRAAKDTEREVLTYDGKLIKPPYFSSDDGQTKTPEQAGWKNFPFANIFSSKPDPWCKGLTNRGHGVGMSGCGALGQAKEGRSAEQILQYYYPGARITQR